MSRHPEARKESDGKLEHKGGNVGRESDKTKVDDLGMEDEMIENIIQHPLQHEVHATACCIAEQLKAHHLAERRIKEIDDLGQGAFYPGFYVFQG